MDAITKTEGPCVVLAGAGTGKTYTIVEKVKYLVENGIYPAEKIVCITFSNEAANNLVLRIDKVLGERKEKPIIRTFHGFSADLLRKYGDRIGLSKEFKILDPQQAMVILHRNLKVHANNCDRYVNTIGTAKDLGLRLEEFQQYLNERLKKFEGVNLEKRMENLTFELQTLHLRREERQKRDLLGEIRKLRSLIELKKFVNAWCAYEKVKQKGNYQDYSDLNMNALALLEKNLEIAKDYDYVIVDEFQDTNKLQLDFLIKLAISGNITVVGDVNQSIYRFRGAYRENLGLFKKAFSVRAEDIFNLDKSYRSSNKILRAAHRLIVNNYLNPDECFFVENVHNHEGGEIEIYELKDAKEEARKVVELIKAEQESGRELEEICVMFRAHQYGRVIKRALEQAGIPYYSVSKASLLKQKSVRTAYDYLVILQKLKKKEKGGEQAWWDLMYQLDFSNDDLIRIGKMIKEFSKKLEKKKDVNGNNLVDVRADNNNNGNNTGTIVSVYLLNNLGKLELSEKGRLCAKIIIEKIKLLLPFVDRPVSELLKEVYRVSGLINNQNTREETEIMLNLNKFYELAKMHEELYDADLGNFLYYLEILGSLGIELEAARLEEKGVRLMTSHSTKGLEYGMVIVTNLCQGRFPIERWVGNSLIPTELMPEIRDEIRALREEEREEFLKDYERHHQLLEERRLAYVSFTRAKDKLVLTFADDYGGKKFLPSVFLNEISFKTNKDIKFVQDIEERWVEREAEIKEGIEFSKALGSEDNFDVLLGQIVVESEREQNKRHERFSPSALNLFEKCQKEFEYRYIYNMPERKPVSWEAIRMGSFVHRVLEQGVNRGFRDAGEFLELAKEMSMDSDWESIELGGAETLIRVFFERNKGKYNEQSKTEQFLPLQLAGMDFIGYADRIDITPLGAEIVDYKTGKSVIQPRERNWQLGFYALAAQEKYGKVRKVVLEMLKQDRPLEFEIDNEGNAVCVSSHYIDGFNIYEVEQELIMAAHRIQEAYKKGFKACAIEKNCEFCNEYVYGL